MPNSRHSVDKRSELIGIVRRLPEDKLRAAAHALRSLEKPDDSIDPPAQAKSWPHAPVHKLTEQGTYIVTTGTLHKQHVFHNAARLTLLESALLSLAEYDWHLEAWAVFSNHYHFVGYTMSSPTRLKTFLTELHAQTARDVNELDGLDGRRVWHNFWDKQLTYRRSYLARLNYVHQNPRRHGLVRVANQYGLQRRGLNAWPDRRR